VKDDRPVSSRGGMVELTGYQQSDPNRSPFKGLVGDDVTGYKDIPFQVFAKGVPKMRVQLVSHRQDVEFRALPPHYTEGYPQVTFKVQEGLSTYKIALKAFSQPGWVENRVDPKKILSLLTSVRIVAFCDDCTVNWQGVVAVDNITFEK